MNMKYPPPNGWQLIVHQLNIPTTENNSVTVYEIAQYDKTAGRYCYTGDVDTRLNLLQGKVINNNSKLSK